VASLPLFPTDDGWPYPDVPPSEFGAYEPIADDEIDLDALELRADPHAYADLSELEYFAVAWRFGLDGPPHSMKDLARELGCNHAEARDVLGAAIDKLRWRLRQP
jgi:hypothetical protein